MPLKPQNDLQSLLAPTVEIREDDEDCDNDHRDLAYGDSPEIHLSPL
jgi:hypothetical protein